MKKVIFLFFAFLLPLLIYFFLKTFGENKFEVPILFADSVTAPVACKAYSYEAPYTVVDSVLQLMSWSANTPFTIVVFEDGSKNEHDRSIQIKRVLTEFKEESFTIVRFFQDSLGVKQNDANKKVQLIASDQTQFESIRNCVFLLPPSHDAVIIDNQKRIRGQYNLTKREDADRMIMEEMNILFNRY